MIDDEAFYYLHRDSNLIGGVITHVDDFTIAGTEDFIKEILKAIEDELKISKVENIISDTLVKTSPLQRMAVLLLRCKTMLIVWKISRRFVKQTMVSL